MRDKIKLTISGCAASLLAVHPGTVTRFFGVLKMSQAENYEKLFQAGNKKQAAELANGMSIRTEQDWKNETTIFIFEDGSAVFASGPEFRQATSKEIEATN